MHAEFEVHFLNEDGKAKAADIAAVFDAALDEIEGIISTDEPSRELSIVRTKLEEACFFAKKAMAKQGENQADA